MKTGIFIVVRTGSSRLPEKALMKVNNMHIIEYLIDRIKFINGNLADIFICTTTLEEDYVLDEIAERKSIKIFHGEPSNIIKRQYDCAVKNSIDFIINVDGDDIFCDPEYINKIIKEHINNPKYDVIMTDGLVFGTNSMGYSITVLDKIINQFKQEKIDTGWGEFVKNEELFNVKKILAEPEEVIEARLTLDYIEDFKVFESIIDNVFVPNQYIYQKEIIQYLKANPKVIEMNYFLNKTYWENYNNKKMEEGRDHE